MTTRRLIVILLIASVLIIALTSLIVGAVSSRMERPLVDGRNIIYGDNYTLTNSIEGDVVIAADRVTIPANTIVGGSASILSDAVAIDGTVRGDLTVFAEMITLGENSVIEGNLSFLGAYATLNGQIVGEVTFTGENLTLANTARVSGAITACGDSITDQRVDAAPLSPCRASAIFEPFAALVALRGTNLDAPTQAINFISAASPVTTLLMLAGAALLLAATSSLIVAAFPRQISCIEEAIRTRPRSLGGVGIATYLFGVGISVAMIVLLAAIPPVGMLLIPIYLLSGLVLIALFLSGWVTLSLVIGDWLARRLNTRRARLTTQRIAPPMLTVAMGSLLMSLIVVALGLLPFGGLIVILLLGAVSSVGIGAALFTRLGTRSLTRSYFVQG